MPITAISSFELKNPSISVNVYSYEFNETKNIIPLRISKVKKEKHVNLLLHNDHYYLIKNFNRFMGGSSWRRFFCEFCLAGYKTVECLQKHLDYCFVPQVIEMPKANTPGAKCKFREFKKTQKFPFIIYADFETIARPVVDSIPANTVTYQSHEAVSYGYVVVEEKRSFIRNSTMVAIASECFTPLSSHLIKSSAHYWQIQ